MRTTRALTLALMALFLFGGCGGSAVPPIEAADPAALIAPSAWRPSSDEPSELLGHAPESVDCPVGAWALDGATIDVDTGACNYLSLRQPAGHDLPPGRRLRLSFAHLQLFDPAQLESFGHLAISVEGQVIYERLVPIPHPARAYDETLVVENGIRAGQQIRIHLHNHGANEWKIFGLAPLDD